MCASPATRDGWRVSWRSKLTAALLKAFIEAQSQHLERFGRLEAHHDASRGVAAEPIEEKILREKKMAVTYALLAERGPAADLRDGAAAQLRAAGFADDDIEDIRNSVALLRQCIPRLDGQSRIAPEGLVGPSNGALRDLLLALRFEAGAENIEHARRFWLKAASTAFAKADDRHAQTLPSDLHEALARAPAFPVRGRRKPARTIRSCGNDIDAGGWR